jgi:hypothetical protein
VATKLCQTKPILGKPKMNITSVQITSYHSPVTLYHYEKQTQTKPILPSQVKKSLRFQGGFDNLYLQQEISILSGRTAAELDLYRS